MKFRAAFSQGNLVKNTILDEWRTHNGVDIRAERGSDLCNFVARWWMCSDPSGLCGEIDHGDGMGIYCGLGSDIGSAAGSGAHAGRAVLVDVVPVEADMEPHLHFEIKVNGRYVEPLRHWVKLNQHKNRFEPFSRNALCKNPHRRTNLAMGGFAM